MVKSDPNAVELASNVVQTLDNLLLDSKFETTQHLIATYTPEDLDEVYGMSPFVAVLIDYQRMLLAIQTAGVTVLNSAPIYQIVAGVPTENEKKRTIDLVGGLVTVERKLTFPKAYVIDITPAHPTKISQSLTPDKILPQVSNGVEDCKRSNGLGLPTDFRTSPYELLMDGKKEVALYRLSGDGFARIEKNFRDVRLPSIR